MRVGRHGSTIPAAAAANFWARSELYEPEIDALLLAAADERGHFVIGAPDLEH